MTVVAAASWGRKTWIASDRAGTTADGEQSLHHEKVERYPWGAVGFAGSYRIVQAVGFELNRVEKLSGWADAQRLVEIVESGLGLCGWERSSSGKLPECQHLSLLFASEGGQLWQLQPDLSILPCKNYAAVGSGAPAALGAMFVAQAAGFSAKVAAEQAVRAACAHDAACAGPAKPWEIR